MFSLLAAQARLSLEHIEYLYSKLLGSRSLISKVTCLGPGVGGVALASAIGTYCLLSVSFNFTLTEDSVFWTAGHRGEMVANQESTTSEPAGREGFSDPKITCGAGNSPLRRRG